MYVVVKYSFDRYTKEYCSYDLFWNINQKWVADINTASTYDDYDDALIIANKHGGFSTYKESFPTEI